MITKFEANREIKDTLYTALFNDETVIPEFFYGITGKCISADAVIKINTIRSILGKGLANDVSFEVDGKLIVLVEHQSTIDANIVYRMLIFVMEKYELLNTDKRSVYKPTLPRPEFYVLYNGKEDMGGESRILRLSDLFADKVPEGETPGLELIVTMYNINKGHNQDMAKRSPTLNGYQTLIQNIRDYEKDLGYDKAVEKAVLEAIDDTTIQWGALKELLKKRKGEVVKMLQMEWTLEDEMTAREEMGMDKGQHKKALEVARKLLARDADVDYVVDVSGLDLNDVLKLKGEI